MDADELFGAVRRLGEFPDGQGRGVGRKDAIRVDCGQHVARL